MLLFALNQSRRFGEAVARALGVSLAEHEERDFEDGEHKSRPLQSVRGRDVYVLQSLHSDEAASSSEKIVRLLFFLAAMRENGAARVTAVIPFLAYGRKDRQTKPRDPVTTRYMAMLLEASGADCVVTLEVHNFVAFQNAFRCRTVHLDSRHLFARRVKEIAGEGPVAVLSPDTGGVKRAQLFQEALQAALGRPVASALVEKRRSAGQVTGGLLVGEVKGARVFVIDDMIVSGGTILRAAQAARQAGALEVHALAAHGLFADGAERLFTDPAIDRVIVTDTTLKSGMDDAAKSGRLEIVAAAPCFAEAIDRLHNNGSITDLLEGRA